MRKRICKYCNKKSSQIECSNCGALTPKRKSTGADSNKSFKDYSYNRYSSTVKDKIYSSWISLTAYIFAYNNLLAKAANTILYPLTGGKPRIKFGKKISILDVGCGTGMFLKKLPKSWETWGVDIVDYGHNSKKMLSGNFETINISRKFDIVRASHTLEHSKNPKRFMKKMLQATKKHGLLVIYTPNKNSLSYKILKDNWVTLNVESHFCIMSPAHVIKYLKEQNCKILYMRTYTLHSAAGSLLEKYGKGNSIVLLLLISVLLSPLTILELITGRADSFVVYAKKI